MGSFSYTGGFSKLPIHDGERTVALVGLYNLNRHEPDEFGPGHAFTPIALPIRGTYNGYGSIENIDDTAGARYLSTFFGGIDVEEFLSTIKEGDSVVSEWKDQVIKFHQEYLQKHKKFNLTSEIYKMFKDKIDEDKIMDLILACNGVKNEVEGVDVKEAKNEALSLDYKKYSLVVILEHEFVFDKLVSMGDTSYADHEFWQTPEDVLVKLGYTPIHKGKSDRSYHLVDYVREGFPTLIRDCYIWPEDKVHDYSHTMHSMSDIAKFIGVEVEEQYKVPYLEYCFRKSMENVDNTQDEYEFSEYTIFRKFPMPLQDHNSVYHFNEYWATDYLFGIYTDEDLLVEENCKDAASIQALINAMGANDITWGFSNYASEMHKHNELAELYQSYADYLNNYVKDREKEGED